MQLSRTKYNHVAILVFTFFHIDVCFQKWLEVHPHEREKIANDFRTLESIQQGSAEFQITSVRALLSAFSSTKNVAQASINDCYSADVEPVVIRLRRELVSRYRELLMPLYELAFKFPQSDAKVIVEQLQPSNTVLSVYTKNPKSAINNYRDNLPSYEEIRVSSNSDESVSDNIAQWKNQMFQRLLFFSSSEYLESLHCEAHELLFLMGEIVDDTSASSFSLDDLDVHAPDMGTPVGTPASSHQNSRSSDTQSPILGLL
jgi:hypothetical protein